MVGMTIYGAFGKWPKQKWEERRQRKLARLNETAVTVQETTRSQDQEDASKHCGDEQFLAVDKLSKEKGGEC